MFDIPTSITIDNVEYPITNKGDYRMVMDCFKALNDPDLPNYYKALTCLTIFYEDFDSVDDVLNLDSNTIQALADQMYLFMNCNDNNETTRHSPKLVDWEHDEQMIASAINNVAKKEIRLEPYIHWWTFMGYYMAIGESTFATVVGIRYKIYKGKKLEKYEKEFQRDNPQYFIKRRTNEDIEADRWFEELTKDE